MLPAYAAILSFDFLATRRRAKRPAAAAPKSNTIGGAGTSWPPLEPVDPPLDEELDEEDEDELLLDEEDEVLPPLPPKLDEVLEPELPDDPLEPEEPLLPFEPP